LGSATKNRPLLAARLCRTSAHGGEDDPVEIVGADGDGLNSLKAVRMERPCVAVERPTLRFIDGMVPARC